MTGVEQIAISSFSGISIALSAATIVVLRRGRRYSQETVELYDEATKKWEELAERRRHPPAGAPQ
jgi:hypothetical protein